MLQNIKGNFNRKVWVIMAIAILVDWLLALIGAGTGLPIVSFIGILLVSALAACLALCSRVVSPSCFIQITELVWLDPSSVGALFTCLSDTSQANCHNGITLNSGGHQFLQVLLRQFQLSLYY